MPSILSIMPPMLSMEAPVAKPTQRNTQPGRILIVEDEELIRDTIAFALDEEGYEIITAADGRSALEIVHTFAQATYQGEGPRIDLIVLDLMLPYVNGLDFCRLVRREGQVMSILMLSAKGSEMDRVVGLEVGADDYLTKPFGMRELVARCRALLRRQRVSASGSVSVLSFQDISLFPSECRVVVRGSEVNLSPKEFRILELFMSYPRRVWSREQLLERVWGLDYVGDTKTVDVHIRWLREKIERDPSRPHYLMTVRGFGYRFG